MPDIQIDATITGLNHKTADLADRAERFDFDGVFTPKTGNKAFLRLPIIVHQTESIRMGTRIALAFTRSPMDLAYTAWDFVRFFDGRFVLGLGTQVKSHNERRFSLGWTSPGPRLREVVESIQHIFEVFQCEAELDYEGEHYAFSLMTDEFSPGPIDHPAVPIHSAGVNEYNIRLAGELCDGLAIHQFKTLVHRPTSSRHSSPRAPTLATARSTIFSCRPAHSSSLLSPRRSASSRANKSGGALLSTGSTRTYFDVLEYHGWTSIGKELHDLSREQRWGDMAELETDEMVSTFALKAPPAMFRDKAEVNYGGVADRVHLSLEHAEAYLGE